MERLTRLLNSIEPADAAWEDNAWQRLKSQIRPRGSLGQLEVMGARLAAMKRTLTPSLGKKLIFTMAGDHGVAAEGVSAYPQEVTGQMVYSFVQGWASINVLARHVGADVRVVDCGVASDLPPEWPVVHRKIAKGTRLDCRRPRHAPIRSDPGAVAWRGARRQCFSPGRL